MMAEKLQDYLRHMQEGVKQASDYISGMDKAGFVADKRTQQAVIMNLVIIGEAATRAMKEFPEFTEEHPDIPWRNMRGMRNRIAHGYFDIDLEQVWERRLQPCQT
ncbi:HepT-like ribonuclease domain-containing protein [Asticcacaulis benevestitus]|uniref:DUF86 domain-containing protein n=1 Tax=Asticcacaulis benevestitus DSM 16100 = ATCC BAA-896 TaxID=1121022 RepID=V4PZS0_9CAUL|nr:DUF86 domain-containing protein [Asticcacaulis benevestitus]ESQ93886.1 hypothetical protein ABENE_04155 [Asticcacaulis benevestitus DSM 16100 = ATCC BAA-896]